MHGVVTGNDVECVGLGIEEGGKYLDEICQ